MPETQAVDPHNGHQMSQDAEKFQLPEVGIEPGPQDLKANTLPRRCKSRLLPQGSRSVLYTYPYYIPKSHFFPPNTNLDSLTWTHGNIGSAYLIHIIFIYNIIKIFT